MNVFEKEEHEAKFKELYGEERAAVIKRLSDYLFENDVSYALVVVNPDDSGSFNFFNIRQDQLAFVISDILEEMSTMEAMFVISRYLKNTGKGMLMPIPINPKNKEALKTILSDMKDKIHKVREEVESDLNED